MERCSNQIARDKTPMKYSKQIIGCAFVIACMTSSASAMLPRAAKALNRTRLSTAFLHTDVSTLANGHNINHGKFSTREYNDKTKSSEIEQRNIVIKKLLEKLPKNQINSVLDELPSQGVGADAISVVQRLYAEIEISPPTIDKHPTFPQSVTGC